MSQVQLMQDYMDELAIHVERMDAAGARIGLRPCATHFKMVTDLQMAYLIAYVMLPRVYRHWSYGKQAQQWLKRALGGGFHIFEAVINSRPSYCYLSTTNSLPRQLQVIAHATYGHIVFFMQNGYFAHTDPDTVLSRFSRDRNIIDNYRSDPNIGHEAVDYYLDAARAIQQFCGLIPVLPGIRAEAELRAEMLEQLTKLRGDLTTVVSGFDKSRIKKEIQDIEERLVRIPLRPIDDLLGHLMDPASNPGLPDWARDILSIVRDQARYLKPQGLTKYMNEGFAKWAEREVLLSPEVDLEFDVHLDAIIAMVGHDNEATNWFFDPYALGQLIWTYIDDKYCPVQEGKFDTVKVEILERNSEGILHKTGRFKTVEVPYRDRSKLYEILQTYDDNRFMSEFLNTELLEQINLKGLDWVTRMIAKINNHLKNTGWGPQVIFEPVPTSLEGAAQAIQTWIDIAEAAESGFQQYGIPRFPVSAASLQSMSTIVQLVGAYDQDKHRLRKMLVMRNTPASSVPYIHTTRVTNSLWTLEHVYDPNYGPLKQGEAKDTLRYFRRLCERPVRLLTMELKYDKRGRAISGPHPYEYFTRDGVDVEEQFLI